MQGDWHAHALYGWCSPSRRWSCPARRIAQATIAGTVRDTSGAVLPGVTVEAASPALIEKVRTAVTDGSGQYRIVEPAARPVRRDVHPARLQHRQARRHRADRPRTRHHQRRAAGRRRWRRPSPSPAKRRSWTCRAPSRNSVMSSETLAAVPATRGYNALVFLVPSVTGGSNQVDLSPMMRIFYSHGGRGNEGRVHGGRPQRRRGAERRRRVAATCRTRPTPRR